MIQLSSISSQTRLADLLTAHPELMTRLPLINRRFHLLHSPMAKGMIQKATIADMSKRSGMDEAILIHAIEDAIRTIA